MEASNPGDEAASLSLSTRRANYRAAQTPEVLHEPFKELSANTNHRGGASTSKSYMESVPLTAGIDNNQESRHYAHSNHEGSGHGNGPLSSSVSRAGGQGHTANKRSIGSSIQQVQYGYSPYTSDDTSFTSTTSSSTAATTPPREHSTERKPEPLRGYYKHQVVPSLTSGVPPVVSNIKPKGWPSSSTRELTSANSGSSSVPSAWDSPTAWICYYFVANLSLTLYNKLLMNKFPFAWSLTAIHALSGCIGASVCQSKGFFTPQKLSNRENGVLIAFSALYTINIAVSNLSLNLVTVPFHQVVRAMTPLFTIILATIFLKKRSSRATWLALVPVVAGVVFATYGDYYFTTWGLILTLLGTLLAAMKTLVTNMILVGRLKLHPLDLLLRMSPLAFIQCVFASWYTGELDRVRAYGATELDGGKLIGLAMNGAIAFALNVVSFTANKKTSALSMTVAANVKQVLTIVLAVMIFNLSINATNLFGISLTLFGGALYAKVELDAKKAKEQLNGSTTQQNGNAIGNGSHSSHVEEKKAAYR